MTSILRYSEGVDYLDKGHTITYRADILRQLLEKTKQIRRGTRGVIFHQDNTPAHSMRVAMAAIQRYGFQLVDDPPCSPDLALSDYCLFPRMKKELGGYNFARDDDVDHFLRDQNGAFYTEGISLPHDRWTKCVNVGKCMLKNDCI